ncbi:MAG: radical SAM protein [Phycisphaerae bacterium]
MSHNPASVSTASATCAAPNAPLSPTAKKWRLFRAYAAGNPIWCAWQVTYRCNYRCGFCHYWRDPMGELPEQTIEQIQIGSQKLANLGSLMVSIAGGEPLLRPDMPDVVRAIGRWHFPFMTTHGGFVTAENAAALFDAGLWGVSVSIDYADPARHNKSRGMKHAHADALAAIDHFVRARRHPWQRVNLMCVLLHDNLDQLDELIRLAADHGAYFMIQPYSFRKTGSQRFRYVKSAVSPRLLELRARHPNFLSNPSFLANFDAFLSGGVSDCKAGRAFFNIDSTGDVAICVEERARPVANLFRDPPRTLVERLKARSDGNTCTDCWYNCRGEVESLYKPRGLIQSLPTLLMDYGRPRNIAPRPAPRAPAPTPVPV